MWDVPAVCNGRTSDHCRPLVRNWIVKLRFRIYNPFVTKITPLCLALGSDSFAGITVLNHTFQSRLFSFPVRTIAWSSMLLGAYLSLAPSLRAQRSRVPAIPKFHIWNM